MKKLKILYIDNQQSGCFWYRIKLPADELKKRGHEIHMESPNLLNVGIENYDIIQLSRGVVGNVDNLILMLDHYKSGAKLVYETDDALELVQYHNIYYEPIKNALFTYFRMLDVADGVITTTDYLKKHLEHSAVDGKPIYVLPNSLNLRDWKERPHGEHPIRIGFSGSITHLRDIIIALEAIIRLQDKYDLEVVVFGFNNSGSTLDDLLENYRIVLDKNFENRHFIHPLFKSVDNFVRTAKKIKNFKFESLVPIQIYPHKLSKLDFDIGICPLEDTKFNKCKSALKYYEYALCGTAVLASNITPYKEEVPYLADNTVKDWEEKLEKLIVDKQFRDELVVKQKEWVLANRDVAKNVDMLEKIYYNVVEGK